MPVPGEWKCIFVWLTYCA